MPSATKYPTAAPFLPDTPRLPHLAAAAGGCEGCNLFRDATQTVFGAGPERARVMLVGEQPGDAEDRQGAPFVGPAGKVLDRAIAAAGLDRGSLYVTNAVKHFSFSRQGARRLHKTPDSQQIVACRPWLVAEVQAVEPELIVCLGATAVKSLLGSAVKVTKDRGEVRLLDSAVGPRRFLVTVHPSSILRGPPELRDEAFTAFVADLTAATP